MTKSDEKRFEDAIKKLRVAYKNALTDARVRDALCYAFYYTWKDLESKSASFHKCCECKWHNGEISTVGIGCTNPNKKWSSAVAHLKYNSTRACKMFEEA